MTFDFEHFWAVCWHGLAILPLPGAKVLGLSTLVFGIAVTPAKLKHAAAKRRDTFSTFFNNLACQSAATFSMVSEFCWRPTRRNYFRQQWRLKTACALGKQSWRIPQLTQVISGDHGLHCFFEMVRCEDWRTASCWWSGLQSQYISVLFTRRANSHFEYGAICPLGSQVPDVCLHALLAQCDRHQEAAQKICGSSFRPQNMFDARSETLCGVEILGLEWFEDTTQGKSKPHEWCRGCSLPFESL